MDVSGFIATFRSELSDNETPQAWRDEEIVAYLNEAVQEACERSYLIEDRSTASVCSVALVAGTNTYDLHQSVFQIKRVVFRGRPLDEASVESMDAHWDAWETREGQPRWFIFEQSGGASPARIRLVPTPTEAETIALTVYRGALVPLSPDPGSDKPELHERFHARLKDWVYRCAYLKQDADTFDKMRAVEYEALFEASFGKRQDSNVQRKHRDRRPPVVSCSW